MGEALAMAQQAVVQGTDTLVATPHRGWSLRISPTPDVIRQRVALLQTELDWARIPLKIIPGLEIKIGPKVAKDLVEGTLGTLGEGSRWVLIELPFDHIPADALKQFREIRDAGYEVLLAHPERYSEIQKSRNYLEDCANLGMAFQLTSGSLLGRFGSRAQTTAESILRRADDWPLVIASDTHDLRERSPAVLRAARDAAAVIVGDKLAQEMVDSRPRSMISAKTL